MADGCGWSIHVTIRVMIHAMFSVMEEARDRAIRSFARQEAWHGNGRAKLEILDFSFDEG